MELPHQAITKAPAAQPLQGNLKAKHHRTASQRRNQTIEVHFMPRQSRKEPSPSQAHGTPDQAKTFSEPHHWAQAAYLLRSWNSFLWKIMWSCRIQFFKNPFRAKTFLDIAGWQVEIQHFVQDFLKFASWQVKKTHFLRGFLKFCELRNWKPAFCARLP